MPFLDNDLKTILLEEILSLKVREYGITNEKRTSAMQECELYLENKNININNLFTYMFWNNRNYSTKYRYTYTYGMFNDIHISYIF